MAKFKLEAGLILLEESKHNKHWIMLIQPIKKESDDWYVVTARVGLCGKISFYLEENKYDINAYYSKYEFASIKDIEQLKPLIKEFLEEKLLSLKKEENLCVRALKNFH